MRKESNQRQNVIVERLAKIDKRIVIVESTNSYQPSARTECLNALIPALVSRGITRLVLERDESFVHSDRQAISRLLGLVRPERELAFIHLGASEEPLLWLADAVAWAYQRGEKFQKSLGQIELVS